MYYIDGVDGPRQKVFDRRIKQGGRRKTVIDIYYDGVPVKFDVAINGGEIRVDRDAGIRRTGTLNVADKTLGHGIAEEVLSPYGTEVLVRHGLVYPNRQEELIPVGLYIIDTISWSEDSTHDPHHSHDLELLDRSMVMSRADIGPTLSYAGWFIKDVIDNLMAYFWPELTVLYDEGLYNWRLPGGTSFNSGNHWEIVQQMARNMGGEIYFDVSGNPVVKWAPEFTNDLVPGDAVWTFDGTTAVDDGTLVDADRAITREGVYNSIYVIGQATNNGAPPVGVAYNVDPESPTNRNGPFRKMGKRIEDNTLITAQQCQLRADQELAQLKRLAKTQAFSAVPNPCLDAGDIVNFNYPSGDSELGILDSFRMSLGEGSFSGNCSVGRI